ncbi:MAG: tRNA (N6-isopentenyl adenosine(37)-C2)-methylthiotransferase MiaB [Betaproteobacteria bacterium]|nr:tRNA (N6-isopentenyl adenosine(37)-C2)-methylthiotransferase MiaB [Betaproteobacteria bacterium]
MQQRYFIRTFGCQMNEYDSQRMADALRVGCGMEAAGAPEEADVIVLNTCSVRAKAAEKLFDELGRLRKHKQARPEVLIGVAGCVASQEGAAIIGRAPYVDLVFGPQALHRVGTLIRRRRQTGVPQIDLQFPEIEKFDSLPAATAEGPRAFVAAMEGCSKYCSFCVVPYTRGPEFSRPLADVLEEVAGLALQGVREVTLLGQNVNAYAGAEPGGGIADLARLAECVANVEGIERIRYTTSHPVNFTQRLIDAHAANPRLMPQVHLPVQSGDDRILARMKRGYTAVEYKAIVRRLRRAQPGISLTSDFIVGFPGESERQFANTLRLVEEVGFDGGFSFIYSARPGTPAAALADDLSTGEKKQRLHQLQELLDSQFAAGNRRRVGENLPVLVEGSAKSGGLLTGRAPDNRVVNFSGAARIGEMVQVAIEAAGRFSLRGGVVA